MDPSTEAELKLFAAANNEFAVNLYRELRGVDGDLFFAPYSIRSALILAYAGARGRTAAQMAEVLRLSASDPDAFRACRDIETEIASRAKPGAIEIDTASALWRQADLPLLPHYVDLVRDALGAKLLEADFEGSPGEASRVINDWVKTQTRGRITRLINPDDINPMTRLVLATAIFFQGKWENPFPRSATRPAPFWPAGSESSIEVATMSQMGEFGYAKPDGLQVVELPYRGGRISMSIILPDARYGLVDLEKELSPIEIFQWFRGLRKAWIKVLMPKFRIGSSFGLEQELDRMGMRDAFSLDSADFSGMTLEKPFGITKVTHSSRVEVDEAGTRAAAASLEICVLGVLPAIQVDHPFLFAIRDIPTDTILFIGRVLKPEWSGDDAGEATRPRRLTKLLKTLGLK